MPPKQLPAPPPADLNGATGGVPALPPPQGANNIVPHVDLPPAVVQGPAHLSPPLALPQPPSWPAMNREDFELLEDNERAEYWAQLIEAQSKTAAYLATVDARQQLQQQQHQQQQQLALQLEQQQQQLHQLQQQQQEEKQRVLNRMEQRQQQQPQLQQQQQPHLPLQAQDLEREQAKRLAAQHCGYAPSTTIQTPHVNPTMDNQAGFTQKDLEAWGLIPKPLNRAEDPTVFVNHSRRQPAENTTAMPGAAGTDLGVMEKEIRALRGALAEMNDRVAQLGVQDMETGSIHPRRGDSALDVVRINADRDRRFENAKKATPAYRYGQDFDSWWILVRCLWQSAGVDPDQPGQDKTLKLLLFAVLIKSDEKNNDDKNTLLNLVRLLNPVEYCREDNFPDFLDRVGAKLRCPARASAMMLNFQQYKQSPNDSPILYGEQKLAFWYNARGNGPNSPSDLATFYEHSIRGLFHPLLQNEMWNRRSENLLPKIENWIPALTMLTMKVWRSIYEGHAPPGHTFRGLRLASELAATSKPKAVAVNQLQTLDDETVHNFDPETGEQQEGEADDEVLYENPTPGLAEQIVYALTPNGARRQCFDCGSLYHFRSSPACPKEGAGLYLPKKIVNNNVNKGGALKKNNNFNRGGTQQEKRPPNNRFPKPATKPFTKKVNFKPTTLNQVGEDYEEEEGTTAEISAEDITVAAVEETEEPMGFGWDSTTLELLEDMVHQIEPEKEKSPPAGDQGTAAINLETPAAARSERDAVQSRPASAAGRESTPVNSIIPDRPASAGPIDLRTRPCSVELVRLEDWAFPPNIAKRLHEEGVFDREIKRIKENPVAVQVDTPPTTPSLRSSRSPSPGESVGTISSPLSSLSSLSPPPPAVGVKTAAVWVPPPEDEGIGGSEQDPPGEIMEPRPQTEGAEDPRPPSPPPAPAARSPSPAPSLDSIDLDFDGEDDSVADSGDESAGENREVVTPPLFNYRRFTAPDYGDFIHAAAVHAARGQTAPSLVGPNGSKPPTKHKIGGNGRVAKDKKRLWSRNALRSLYTSLKGAMRGWRDTQRKWIATHQRMCRLDSRNDRALDECDSRYEENLKLVRENEKKCEIIRRLDDRVLNLKRAVRRMAFADEERRRMQTELMSTKMRLHDARCSILKLEQDLHQALHPPDKIRADSTSRARGIPAETAGPSRAARDGLVALAAIAAPRPPAPPIAQVAPTPPAPPTEPTAPTPPAPPTEPTASTPPAPPTAPAAPTPPAPPTAPPTQNPANGNNNSIRMAVSLSMADDRRWCWHIHLPLAAAQVAPAPPPPAASACRSTPPDPAPPTNEARPPPSSNAEMEPPPSAGERERVASAPFLG